MVDVDRLYVRAKSATLTLRFRFSMSSCLKLFLVSYTICSLAAFFSGTFLQGLLIFAKKNRKCLNTSLEKCVITRDIKILPQRVAMA